MGGLVVECIRARLLKVSVQLQSKPCLLLWSMPPQWAIPPRKTDHLTRRIAFEKRLTTWSQWLPAEITFLSYWMRMLVPVNDTLRVCRQ